MAIDIQNLPAGVVPPEIQQAFNQLLQVQGRVSFPLKPTRASAVSTSAQTPDEIKDIPDKEIDDLISSVDEMEDLVEQLEDMADQLTKDMNIPIDPDNKPLLRATQRLGGDNAITQDVFNNALAIIDHAPLMTLRQDPVIAALTGDGHLEGPWLDCSQVTEQAADFFKLRNGRMTFPEEPVVPRDDEVLRDFEENLAAMILHILLMLWWNMIWPKFLVDLVIIDPLRLMIADPLDGLIGFFKRKRRFRKKSKDWVRKKGKINKALNKFRKFLLCVVPYKLWSTADKDYDPIVEIDCPAGEDYSCPEDTTQYGDAEDPDSASSPPQNFDKKGGIEQMGNIVDDVDGDGEDDSDTICGAPDEFGDNAPDEEPEGLGMSPECLQAAARVVSAVENATYTPRRPSPNDPTLQTDLSRTVEDNFAAPGGGGFNA